VQLLQADRKDTTKTRRTERTPQKPNPVLTKDECRGKQVQPCLRAAPAIAGDGVWGLGPKPLNHRTGAWPGGRGEYWLDPTHFQQPNTPYDQAIFVVGPHAHPPSTLKNPTLKKPTSNARTHTNREELQKQRGCALPSRRV
jgi:hypothetical protein